MIVGDVMVAVVVVVPVLLEVRLETEVVALVLVVTDDTVVLVPVVWVVILVPVVAVCDVDVMAVVVRSIGSVALRFTPSPQSTLNPDASIAWRWRDVAAIAMCTVNSISLPPIQRNSICVKTVDVSPCDARAENAPVKHALLHAPLTKKLKTSCSMAVVAVDVAVVVSVDVAVLVALEVFVEVSVEVTVEVTVVDTVVMSVEVAVDVTVLDSVVTAVEVRVDVTVLVAVAVAVDVAEVVCVGTHSAT